MSTPPTGPAIVGFETVILPSHVRVTPEAPLTVEVSAPACRYGAAVYTTSFVRRDRGAASSRLVNWREFPGTIRSGTSLRTRIPDGWEGAEIRLRLLEIALHWGALLDLTAEELADALAHPFQEVRQEAMMDLGQ